VIPVLSFGSSLTIPSTNKEEYLAKHSLSKSSSLFGKNLVQKKSPETKNAPIDPIIQNILVIGTRHSIIQEFNP